MLIILLFSTGVMCGVFLQVNGQCTTPGCKGSSGGTDEMVEELLEDHDNKMHGMYQRLLEKIEKNDKRMQSMVQQMAELHLAAKYKVCPPGFKYLPGADGCFKVIFQKLNWTEAGNECRKLIPGAHLTAITSAEKQKAIKEFLGNEFTKSESMVCLFKGGDNWREGELTVWTSGETEIPEKCKASYEWKILDTMKIPFNYTNWIILEPSCGEGNEHCTQIVKGKDAYEWNDLNCSNKTCALCEL